MNFDNMRKKFIISTASVTGGFLIFVLFDWMDLEDFNIWGMLFLICAGTLGLIKGEIEAANGGTTNGGRATYDVSDARKGTVEDDRRFLKGLRRTYEHDLKIRADLKKQYRDKDHSFHDKELAERHESLLRQEEIFIRKNGKI